MATWTTMNNLSTGDLVTEADMDAIRGNIEYLLNPNEQRQQHTAGSNYTTTSTSFVDVDATNLACTITTNGGPVLVIFTGTITNATVLKVVNLDIDVDGTRESGVSEGLLAVQEPVADYLMNGCFSTLVTGLDAGSHTFKLQWSVDGGTGKLWNTSAYVAQLIAIEL